MINSLSNIWIILFLSHNFSLLLDTFINVGHQESWYLERILRFYLLDIWKIWKKHTRSHSYYLWFIWSISLFNFFDLLIVSNIKRVCVQSLRNYKWFCQWSELVQILRNCTLFLIFFRLETVNTLILLFILYFRSFFIDRSYQRFNELSFFFFLLSLFSFILIREIILGNCKISNISKGYFSSILLQRINPICPLIFVLYICINIIHHSLYDICARIEIV